MPDRIIETYAFQGFDGGLVTQYPNFAIEPDASPDAENFDPGFLWRLRKRYGTTSFSGTHGSPTGTLVRGLAAFTFENGTTRILAKEGTALYDISAGNWSTAFSGYTPVDATEVYMTMFKNIVIITDTARAAVGQIADSTTTAVTALGGSPVACRFSCVHKGRVVLANSAANPSIVYHSALNNPEDWSTAGDFFSYYCGRGDGMEINGLVSDGDVLYISKKSPSNYEGAIYAVFGDGPSDIKPPRRIAWFGATSQHAFIPSQSFVVAMTRNGLYGIKGTQFLLLSNAVNRTFLDMSNAERADIAVGQKGNQLFVAYRDTNNSTNNKALVLDVFYKRWSRYNPFTSRILFTAPDGTMYGASSTSTVRVLKHDDSSVYADIGSAIAMYWTTPALDFGQWFADKRLRQSIVHVMSDARSWTLTRSIEGAAFGDSQTIDNTVHGYPMARIVANGADTAARLIQLKLTESSSSLSEAYGMMVEADIFPRSR